MTTTPLAAHDAASGVMRNAPTSELRGGHMRGGDLKRKRAQLCLASLGGVHVVLKVQANVGHRAALALPPGDADQARDRGGVQQGDKRM